MNACQQFRTFRRSARVGAVLLVHSLTGLSVARVSAAERAEVVVTPEAERIHASAMLWDGHNDLPWELRSRGTTSFDKVDLTKRHGDMHTDIPRLRAGGLKSQFWSVYVPVSTSHEGVALQTTLEQIDLVHAMVRAYPEHFTLALTSDDVEKAVADGRIASLIGMEGGHCIENSLNVLRQLYERGARYMTLTHSESLDWADSATDTARHGGLTPFGEEVVREMNRIGMLVDLSHVSEETMIDALAVTSAPVMFSHSSARALADHPRNVSDRLLEMTARNGGIVMVNFFSAYVVPESARQFAEKSDLEKKLRQKYPDDEDAVKRELKKWEVAHPLKAGDIYDVVDHIDHIVKVAGIDHVGLGSDYDGVSILPRQMESVATYPRITQVLLDRGYSEEDIHKILGANMLRVMRGMERAKSAAATP